MNRNEYTKWANDFRKMLPDTGAWLFARTQETRDFWFDEVFSKLDLADCQAATLKIMDEPIPATQRERIPAIISKHCAEICYQRRENARRTHERKRTRQVRQGNGCVSYTANFDAGMKRAYNGLLDYMREYRTENQTDYTPPELVSAWIDENGGYFDG